MKVTLSGFLFVLVFGMSAWWFSGELVLPGVENPYDSLSLYDLTKQTAINTRWIFMLLSALSCTAFAIFICRIWNPPTNP